MGLKTIAQRLRVVALTQVKPKVYVDMDGTICDFSRAVKELGPGPAEGLPKDSTQEQKQLMWDEIDKVGPDFWSKMKWLPDGKKLWALVKDYNPVLLSNPGKFRFAKAGKEIWVSENLPGVSLFLDMDKSQYAEDGSILIDDDQENISSFREYGGEGILHENYEKTKEELEKLLN